MASLVHIQWKPSAAELRKFGAAMIVGWGAIGGLLYWRGAIAAAYGCWMFGAAAGILGLTGTAAGLPLYWLWMGVGFVIGSVVGRLLLALCYYGVLTPIALLMRLRGRDALRVRRRECESYWVDLPPPPPPERYERQF